MRLPPDNQPLLLARPWLLARSVIAMVVAATGIALLFRTAVMTRFNIAADKKLKRLAKVVGLGTLLMLANIGIAMLSSSVAIMILA